MPAAVTQLRLTGYSSSGAVLYGPQTKAKAAVMEFTQVPVSVRQVQVEYLQGGTPVGLGRTQVTLVEGAVFTLSDLDFEDIEASLVGLTLEPTALTLAKGTSGRLQAVGRYSDDSVLDLSNSVTWSASNPSVEVRPDGTVLARTPGTANVTASYAGRSVTASVVVTDATVASLRFEPSTFRLPSGVRQSFVVRATMSDGSQQDVTSSVTSSVDDDEVADLIGGQLVGGEPGETVLRASLGGQSAQARVEVIDAVLTRIDVSPLTPDLPLGATLQLSAVGVYSDLSTVDLSDSVTWRSQVGTLLQVSSGGLAEGLAVGSAPVTATLGETVGGTTIEVVDAVVTELSVDVTELRLLPGLRRSLVVTATYSDDSELEVTDQALYESSAPSVATVTTLGERGQIRALAAGNTTITVSFGGQETTVEVGVGDATVTGLTVGMVQLELPKGTSQTLVATAAYSDGSFYNVTSDVTWTSLDSEIAEIDALGKVTGVAEGSTSVQGTFQGRMVVLPVEVGIEPQTGLELSPSSDVTLSFPKGVSGQLTVYALHGPDTILEVTNEASYLSSDTSVLTVSTTGSVRGVLTGVAEGNATVTVSYGGFSQEVAVVVEPARLVSLKILPQDAMSAPGSFRQYTAMGIQTDGSEVDLTDRVSWSSSSAKVGFAEDPGVARLATDTPTGYNSRITVSAALGAMNTSTTLYAGAYLFAGDTRTPAQSGQSGDLTVYSYDGTGRLTLLTSHASADSPHDLAVHPSGRYIYVPDPILHRIVTFRIEPGGTLNLQQGIRSDTLPDHLTIDPTGRYLFVANSQTATIGSFIIGANGRLTANNPSRGPINVGGRPRDLDVSRDGRFLFVTDRTNSKLHTLAIDSEGRLSRVSDESGITLNGAMAPRAHPKLDQLFAIASDDRMIRWWAIGPGGQLTPYGSAAISSFYQQRLDFSPDFRYLYTVGLARVFAVELSSDGTSGTQIDNELTGTTGEEGVLESSGRFYYATRQDGAGRGIKIYRRETSGRLTFVEELATQEAASAYAVIP